MVGGAFVAEWGVHNMGACVAGVMGLACVACMGGDKCER